MNITVLCHNADANAFTDGGIEIVGITDNIGDFLWITVLAQKAHGKGFGVIAVSEDHDGFFFQHFFERNALKTADGRVRTGQKGKFIGHQRYIGKCIRLGQG